MRAQAVEVRSERLAKAIGYFVVRCAVDSPGWTARGFALGTASHGIGAARALHVNADAGAYAGLALGLQVVLAALLLPLLFRLLG